MKRSRPLVGFAFGLACACIVLTSSAQKKKPAKGGSQATAPASSKPAALPRGRGNTGKKPTEEAKSPDSEAKVPAATGHQVVERESHIEFDERMVRGQSAAGAIYLFNRQPSEFKSIVKVPESFRDRTTVLVTPRGENP